MTRGNFEPKDPVTGVAEKHRQAALGKGKKAKGPYASYKGIDKVIAEMLTENTGISMLDSGGASSRGWQQNQGRDFKKEDAVIVEAYEDDDQVTIYFNLFHFLTSYLELNDNTKKLQKKFDKFARSPEQEDEVWLVSMEEFASMMDDGSAYGFTGVENTYNYDNVLSGVIQFAAFSYEDDKYMVMSTHNGADVRGGYSKPKVFKIPDPDYFIIAQNDIYASTDKFAWDSDDGGYTWRGEVSYEDEDGEIPELEFDVRDEKVFLKGTDDEVTFSVMESY